MQKPNKLMPETAINWSKGEERELRIPLWEGLCYFVLQWKKILALYWQKK